MAPAVLSYTLHVPEITRTPFLFMVYDASPFRITYVFLNGVYLGAMVDGEFYPTEREDQFLLTINEEGLRVTVDVGYCEDRTAHIKYIAIVDTPF